MLVSKIKTTKMKIMDKSLEIILLVWHNDSCYIVLSMKTTELRNEATFSCTALPTFTETQIKDRLLFGGYWVCVIVGKVFHRYCCYLKMNKSYAFSLVW